MSLKAVILAGGKATRMGDLAKEIPKPMLPIAGKPVLEHQLELLKEYGITEVFILVNHLKDAIIQYCGDGSQWGVHITYFEEPYPMGTVGGIKEIEKHLTTDFLVLYGDVMVNMDLHRLIDFHRSHMSECTLVLHPNDHPFDSDLVDIDINARVTAFHPKPHAPEKYYRNLVNAALYVMTPTVLQFLEQGKKADFGKDIFPDLFNKVRMYGYNTTEYLKDMGTPGRIGQVDADYVSGKIERKSYRHKQKCIFIDRDGVMNIERDYLINHPDQLELFNFTADAVKMINKSDYLAIVITNQAVVAKNQATLEDVHRIHNKMEWDLGKQGAKLDAIYFCPHHPEKGFPDENPLFKMDCDCRKPKPGMLLQAAQDFNIDLSQSWMIGDAERDIIAATAAGCKTVGVYTGKGLKGAIVKPDLMADDIEEAVKEILKYK